MPYSLNKVQGNYEIAKQHVLGKWKFLLLLGQHCFSQSFGLCWLQLHSSHRYRIRRDWELGVVGGGSGMYSKPRWLIAAIYSFFFPVDNCNLELLCSPAGTVDRILGGQDGHPCLLAAWSV